MAELKIAKLKPGTTPLLVLFVDDVDLRGATVYVTIDQGDRKLVRSNYNHEGDDFRVSCMMVAGQIKGSRVWVQYSQADTLCLRPGFASIEVGWVTEDGAADKSDIGRVKIPKTLYEGVMAYGKCTS